MKFWRVRIIEDAHDTVLDVIVTAINEKEAAKTALADEYDVPEVPVGTWHLDVEYDPPIVEIVPDIARVHMWWEITW